MDSINVANSFKVQAYCHAHGKLDFHIRNAEDLLQHALYPEFIHLEIIGTSKSPLDLSLITQWPINLQVLTLSWCNIQHIPDLLPPKLCKLSMEHNKLTEIPPALKYCTLLQTLDISDNYISHVNGRNMPPNVLSVNLSYNQIKRVVWATLPSRVKHIDVSHNFLVRLPSKYWRKRSNYEHNSDLNYFCLEKADRHLDSLMDSDSPSIIVIANAAERASKLPRHWLVDMVNNVWFVPGDILINGVATEPFMHRCKMKKVLKKWCKTRNVHPEHLVNTHDLLRAVWKTARCHPRRDIIRDRLRNITYDMQLNELFSCILNAVTGFLD